MKTLTPKQIEKFWDKVDKRAPTECWPWIGARCGKGCKTGKGYGHLTVNKVLLYATRVGWFIIHGVDPYPLHVLHSCDNSRCCNPSHWFTGTNRDNCQDKSRKFRNGRKLTAEKVSRIKALLRTDMTLKAIADKFGVTPKMIDFIKHGVYWAHVH